MQKVKIAVVTAIILAIVAVSFIGGRKSVKSPKIGQSDTVIVTRIDTAVVRHPVYIERKVIDTVYVSVEVEKIVRDTISNIVSVPLQMEQKTYADGNYKAWVSGVMPRLDSIAVFNTIEYRTVTERIEPSRWSVGISGGYGLMWSDGLRTGPYVGVGVQYRLW